MALKNYYTDGFCLLRKSESTNAWGGEDAGSWTEICRFSAFLQPVGGNERNANAKVMHDYDHRIYCSHEVEARPQDAISYGGKTYIVVFSQDYGISGLNRHQEVLVRWTDALS